MTTLNHTQATHEPTHASYNTHKHTCADHNNTISHSPVTLPNAPYLTPTPAHPNHLLVTSPATYLLQNTCYTTMPYHPPTYTPNFFPIPYNFPPISDDEHNGITTTFLEKLHRDCNEGTQNATYFMEDIWDFTENCQHEEEEWKANQ